ncbi:hypothetical protein CGCVW01_v006010 [Colletotrichum viniferum]|nr:hypothetical protein CGCVW01_v006010 [Colletotrichum viniferum]
MATHGTPECRNAIGIISDAARGFHLCNVADRRSEATLAVVYCRLQVDFECQYRPTSSGQYYFDWSASLFKLLHADSERTHSERG